MLASIRACGPSSRARAPVMVKPSSYSKRADLTDHQHVVALVIPAVAATLDRIERRKFLLPVTQHVRLHPAQIADLTDGEIALGRDGGQFGVIPLIQHSPRLSP